MLGTDISILVVDDNTDDGRLLEQNLAQTGHSRRLHFCRSMHDAQEIILSSRYDIILTDHHPPEIDAFALLQFLDEHNEAIPVLILTGQGSEKLAAEAIKKGAYDYLTKEELAGGSIAHILETVLERRRLKQEAADATEKLQRMAVLDSLTNVYNRRFFQERLDQEFARSRRYHRALSLIMIDIDHFKDCNDRAGHLGGDEALIKVSQTLTDSVRRVDVVARYGGDEFGVILPETDLHSALRLAQRLRERVVERSLTLDDKIGRLTVSLGVAALSPDIEKPQDLLARADQALYQAKATGRNRVCSGLTLTKADTANL